MSRFKEEILNSQVFLINLDKSTDRFEQAFININVAGFNNIERYSAVDAEELKKKNLLEAEWAKHGSPEFSKIAPPIISIDYKIGRHGCMLSHLNLWKKIIEMPDIKDDTKFVIFEDDVMFHSDWDSLAPFYYDETPTDFDILFIGNQLQIMDQNNTITINTIEKPIATVPTFTTHAYVITRKGVEKIYKQILQCPRGIYTLDLMLFDIMKDAYNVNCSHDKLPFIWYCWNVTKFFPCKELEKLNVPDENMVVNTGMVFQNHKFASLI